MKYLIFFLAFVASMKAYSQAACTNMQMQINQTSFDLFSSQSVNPTIVVKANTNPGGCDFFITFGYGLATSAQSRNLRSGFNTWPFQLSKDAGGMQILKRIPDVSSTNEVITGTLIGGSNDRQLAVNYWGILDMSNPWLPKGNYEDTYIVTLYRGSPFGSYSLISIGTIRFFWASRGRVDISLVPTGGTFNISDTVETMNFGGLTAGATRTSDAVIKYNAGYILKASSANNGRIKHETENEYIDYTAKFNGSVFSLSNTSGNPVQIERRLGEGPASGQRVPIEVTIGSVAGKRGGNYSDTITLTVQSAE